MSDSRPDIIAKVLWKFATPGNRQARIAPAHLFADERTDPRPFEGRKLHGRRLEVVQADLAVLLEDVPEDGVRRDHVLRVRQDIELFPRGPHHLFGEPVGRVADVPGLL